MDYPDFIDTENIDIDPIAPVEHRLSLTLRFNDRTGHGVTVILKNPSKASEHQSDVTIDRVIRYVHDSPHPLLQSSGYVTIVNLMAIYETDSDLITENLDWDYVVGNVEGCLNNDGAIRDAVVNSQVVIMAWGNKPRKL